MGPSLFPWVSALLLASSTIGGASSGNQQRESPPPKVSTENGVIRGTVLDASEDRVVAAFLGVPYARPPIGDLRYIVQCALGNCQTDEFACRFRPPQDVLDWRRGDDPRDATVAPASCVQRKDYFFADFAGATVDAPRDDELSWGTFETRLWYSYT